MLVAPLAFPVRPAARRQRRQPPRVARRVAPAPAGDAVAVPVWLFAWLAIGSVVLACVPAARYSATFGATVPFWLVAAPLLDLVWLRRAGARASMRRWLRRAYSRRQPSARSMSRRRV